MLLERGTILGDLKELKAMSREGKEEDEDESGISMNLFIYVYYNKVG